MNNEKVVVLCSGGLNSAVLMSLATRERTVAALHVILGDRASQRDAECFEKLTSFFNIRERLKVDMPHFAAIGGNARVSRKQQIEDALAMDGNSSSCHIPGLVGGLVSAAFTWASNIGATRILLGVSEDLGPPGPKTRDVHPDYAQECIHLLNQFCQEASPKRRVGVEAPLIELRRADIVKLGHRLGTPFESTWSCLSGGKEPCGACLGCATRNRGFLDAALPDPLMLEPAQR